MSKLTTIGMMSGTSLDGIDAAIITTDKTNVVSVGDSLTLDYSKEERKLIRDVIRGADHKYAEKIITLKHVEAVKELLKKANLTSGEIDLIGFHGQTILHKPEESFTWQIGDGNLLAKETQIDVWCDFRKKDVESGGQGAPLVPIYHAALAKDKPIAIVNIGGVANITWVGQDLIAFDTGPGNAMINDWVEAFGLDYDKDGLLASNGNIDQEVVGKFLSHEYFKKPPPKSLDRNHFGIAISHLSKEDGAATLTACTVEAIIKAFEFFPQKPNACYITGGGRHNKTIMNMLEQKIDNLYPIESLGYNGDMIEAQAFAFLAVCSHLGLPITFPKTTGVKAPQICGAFFPA